jgi:hypothetical protein
MIDDFFNFSASLTASLSQRAEVIGLIFVGSAAETDRVDEWSDHDFFVITKAGCAEALRNDLSWLPDSADIAIAPRETEHGLKVVYQDGHVLEFAVFNDQELELATVNSFAVAFDKTDITVRVEAIAERSVPKPFDAKTEFELFLATMLIGVGRARRGETLIAGQQIRSYCMRHALGLIRQWVPVAAGTENSGDSLDRFRRFEIQYPEIATQLETLQQTDVEASAKGLLHLILSLGESALTEAQLHQVYVVRNRLGWR